MTYNVFGGMLNPAESVHARSNRSARLASTYKLDKVLVYNRKSLTNPDRICQKESSLYSGS